MIPRRCRVRCVGDVLSVFCLKLFAEGGRVGRPLGNLMWTQLCMCMYSCLNITAVVTAATSQWLPCDWRPDILPRSLPTVSPAPLALSPTSPSLHTLSMSFTFCLPLNPIFSSIHLQVHYLSVSPTSFCFFACFHLSPPHLPCGSSLSFVMLSAPTVLPVSVSMETPSGQEWLRGLWDADTEPIRSHARFFSPREPHVFDLALAKCKPIVCVNRWCVTKLLPAITQDPSVERDAPPPCPRLIGGVKAGGNEGVRSEPCCFIILYVSSIMRLRRGPPDAVSTHIFPHTHM